MAPYSQTPLLICASMLCCDFAAWLDVARGRGQEGLKTRFQEGDTLGITNQVDSSTFAAQACNADSAASWNTVYYSAVTVQLVWSSGVGTGGSVQLQYSNDNANWTNIGSAGTVTGASGSIAIDPNTNGVFNWSYLRLSYTHGSMTAGTMTAYVCLKQELRAT